MLRHIQCIIPALLRQQLCMRSRFHNLPAIHHDNQIRIPDGGKAMGNYDAGAETRRS